VDIRLFKFLILILVEAVLGAAYFLESRYLQGSRVGSLVYLITRYALATLPILILLPEDNWVWLVEEDPRGRKISLRSKASKHLHLSMLYFLLFGYPCLLICISLFEKWEKYQFPPAMLLMAYGFLYGIYCAWKNFRNVKKYDSMFAVAWDRKSSFVEIFVGAKVSKNMKFFYKGFGLFAGILFMAGALLAPWLYYKYVSPFGVIPDRQKFIVLQTIYCFLLAFSVWTVTMYVVFQLFFSRKLETWVREKKS
jgi:hypothetical protein